jgi:EAL domain-containing protein (putative c-di-GMP-specific phosphodiesterase class I)/GGDEF domain-containing protein
MKGESARLLERARGWLDELRELDSAASQVSRLGLITALVLTGVLILLLALAATFGLTAGVNPIASYVNSGIFVAALLVVWRKPRTAPLVGAALVALIFALMLWATWDNGALPFTLLASVVALFHLIVRPGPALTASVLLALAMTAILASRFPLVDRAVLMRLLAAAVASVVFWQLSTRFWRRLVARMRDLGTEMAVTVSQLDAEREEAERVAHQAQQEGRLAQQALKTDAASGLLNRKGFLEALEGMLQPAQPGLTPPAGLLVALRLQAWSDATAHRDAATQHQLLQALVRRIRALPGDDALLARSGADTFLVWMPLTQGTLTQALAACAECAAGLEAAVTSGSASAPTRPRMGVSVAPDDGSDAATLIARAELASVAAARSGQLTPLRYSASLLADAQDRDRLEGEIAQGLARGEFELFYQPLVASRTPRQPQGHAASVDRAALEDRAQGHGSAPTPGLLLHKAECLVRWRHPTRGLVSPGLFIPLAEQSELIIGLTDWVLREAVRQVKIWRATLHPDFQISVNMPPAYLALCVREPARMLERLQTLDMPPGAVVLEITEGVMLEVTPELLQVLSLLRALGFQIALDDFGVGYSSFGQIDRLKLDFLKLDKTFVDDLGSRAERAPICEAIVTMAHHLGFKVVAEGVETELQRAHLARMGADYLQGYLFSKPVPAADLEAWAARA